MVGCNTRFIRTYLFVRPSNIQQYTWIWCHGEVATKMPSKTTKMSRDGKIKTVRCRAGNQIHELLYLSPQALQGTMRPGNVQNRSQYASKWFRNTSLSRSTIFSYLALIICVRNVFRVGMFFCPTLNSLHIFVRNFLHDAVAQHRYCSMATQLATEKYRFRFRVQIWLFLL